MPFWNAIKPYFTDKVNHKPTIMLREGDDIVSESKGVADAFNQYFKDIVSQLDQGDDTVGQTMDEIVQKYRNHESI